MFGAFQTFGKLGAIGKAIASAWSPLALWPDGIATPGMWISPRTLTSQWADYTGTTPVATPGTVADSSNPVGLALDIRAGATVLTDPGNHMLQSTSAARPLESARVNLLTYSQELDNGSWGLVGCTLSANNVTAPDGTLTAESYATNSGNGRIINSSALPANSIVSGVTYTLSIYCKNVSGSGQFFIYCGNGTTTTSSTFTATSAWQRFSFTFTANSTGNDVRVVQVPTAGDLISVWGAQLNLGSTALPYQRVGAASDYDASAGPTYLKFDGVDDSLASATFAAGTLIDGMDCLIAVRRDSAAATYLISDTGSRGFFEWESGNSGRPDVSAGTPTYYVDGVAITATKGALFTALTAGDWHILEARGLDLSTWLKVEVSSLVSYRLNGPSGDILLYPSTASTEDKDAARQWLADYYGVTLP